MVKLSKLSRGGVKSAINYFKALNQLQQIYRYVSQHSFRIQNNNKSVCQLIEVFRTGCSPYRHAVVRHGGARLWRTYKQSPPTWIWLCWRHPV